METERLHGSEGPNRRASDLEGVWQMDEWEAIDAALNERKGSKRALVEIVGDDDETSEVNRKMSLDQPKDVTRSTEGTAI